VLTVQQCNGSGVGVDDVGEVVRGDTVIRWYDRADAVVKLPCGEDYRML
jgi:hypothetical protein